METVQNLNSKILAITMVINNNYPEMSKYLGEMQETIPDERNPKITLNNLSEYYDSLNSMLSNYIAEQQYKKTRKNHQDKNVLIIEPERIIGLELQLQLKKKGFVVQRPITLDDSEKIIAEQKSDVIIADTDIKDQGVFGKIKKYLKKFQQPFIWIGAATLRKTKIENEGMNIIGIFSKPFDSRRVVACIVNYFNKRVDALRGKRKV